jgi:hypothetical protein
MALQVYTYEIVILLAGTILVAMGLTLHDIDFRCGISKIQVHICDVSSYWLGPSWSQWIFLYISGHDMDFRHGSACLHMRFVLLAGTIMVTMGLNLHDMDFRCGIFKIQVHI